MSTLLQAMTLLALAATAPPAATPVSPTTPTSQEKALRELGLVLDLSETGEVGHVECNRDVPANICAVLLPVVKAWTFHPARRDGQPFANSHKLGLTLAAVPQAGSYRLRVDRANLTLASGYMFKRKDPPRYPSAEERRGQGASVTALVVRDSAPKYEPRITQVWVNGEPAGPGNAFQKAAVEAIRSWPLRPVVGAPIFQEACVTMTFNPGIAPMAFKDLSPCQETLTAGVVAGVLLTPLQGVYLN